MKYRIPLMLEVDLGDEVVLAELDLLPKIGRNVARALYDAARGKVKP